MDRTGLTGRTALLPIAATVALAACGGGGGGTDGIPPFDMQTGVVATDLDGDGRNDVAVAPNSAVPVGAGGTTVATADVDNDERIDLLRASSSTDPARVGVYLSLQDAAVAGMFRPALKMAAGQKPVLVAVGDLDPDGRLDLAVAASVPGLVNDNQSVVQLYLQDPARPGHFVRGGRYDGSDLAQLHSRC